MKIQSAQGDYEVMFVDRFACNKEDLLIVDEHVLEGHEDKFAGAGNPFQFRSLECYKTLEMVSHVVNWMRAHGITGKRGTVVAIGGGILQDVVAMACHLYHRGVRWHYWPTTLLAMADSCIGGKCGINFDGSKNLLGAYSAPSEVRVWPRFLDTLPENQAWSGQGEIAKLLWIDGVASPNWDSPAEALIQRSLSIKQRFIEADEFERGGQSVHNRLYLSYGHTLAHAIESLTNTISHGLAVVAGMRFANWVSLQHGLLDADDYDRAAEELARFPVKVPDLHDDLVQAMSLDKKCSGGTMNMVLTSGPGQMEVYPISMTRLSQHLSEFLAQQ